MTDQPVDLGQKVVSLPDLQTQDRLGLLDQSIGPSLTTKSSGSAAMPSVRTPPVDNLVRHHRREHTASSLPSPRLSVSPASPDSAHRPKSGITSGTSTSRRRSHDPIHRPRTSSSSKRTGFGRQTTNSKKHSKPVPLEWAKVSTKDKTFANGRVLVIDYSPFLTGPTSTTTGPATASTGPTSSGSGPSTGVGATPGQRHIEAREFNCVRELRDWYSATTTRTRPALRVIHVQNAAWARQYLLRKFNINHRDGLLGTDFGKWAEFSRPQHYADKPVLKGKVFPVKPDPWRKIMRGAFGLDYLRAVPLSRTPAPVGSSGHFRRAGTDSSTPSSKPGSSGSSRSTRSGHGRHGRHGRHFPTHTGQDDDGTFPPAGDSDSDPLTASIDRFKLLELNNYDENESTVPSSDVFVQRLSVYVQHRQEDLVAPDEQDIRNPYTAAMQARQWSQSAAREVVRGASATSGGLGGPSGMDHPVEPADEYPHGPFDDASYFPSIDSLDNGNVIIIFDDSHSGLLEDTLISARREIETAWIRMLMYLNIDELGSDEAVAVECIDLVMTDVFMALENGWEKLLDKCDSHMNILQTDLYSNPADESRATELWHNSKYWMVVNRLAIIHASMIPQVVALARDVTLSLPDSGGWLGGTPESFSRVPSLVQEILVKPTDNLNDLMHKSVTIRDARYSIQLNASMWLLSWITFIFLPLTFTASFFQMNQSAYDDDSIVKWFFIISVPFMMVVVLAWYILKYTVSPDRHSPGRRRTYENIYDQLSTDHPVLWTRHGARPDIRPRGVITRLKWRLVQSWFARDRTVNARVYDPDQTSFGLWPQLQLFLVRRWIRQVDEKIDDVELMEQGQHMITREDDSSASPPASSSSAAVASVPAHHALEHPIHRNRIRAATGDMRSDVDDKQYQSDGSYSGQPTNRPGSLELIRLERSTGGVADKSANMSRMIVRPSDSPVSSRETGRVPIRTPIPSALARKTLTRPVNKDRRRRGRDPDPEEDSTHDIDSDGPGMVMATAARRSKRPLFSRRRRRSDETVEDDGMLRPHQPSSRRPDYRPGRTSRLRRLSSQAVMDEEDESDTSADQSYNSGSEHGRQSPAVLPARSYDSAESAGAGRTRSPPPSSSRRPAVAVPSIVSHFGFGPSLTARRLSAAATQRNAASPPPILMPPSLVQSTATATTATATTTATMTTATTVATATATATATAAGPVEHVISPPASGPGHFRSQSDASHRSSFASPAAFIKHLRAVSRGSDGPSSSAIEE